MPTDIDRLRLALAESHARGTVISILGLVTRIARYGASKDLCAGLSFPVILRGKNLGRDPRVTCAPTDEQVDAYIKTCKTCEEWPDTQAGNFQLLIALTGMRRGYARNLKWDDVTEPLINKENPRPIILALSWAVCAVVACSLVYDLWRFRRDSR